MILHTCNFQNHVTFRKISLFYVTENIWKLENIRKNHGVIITPWKSSRLGEDEVLVIEAQTQTSKKILVLPILLEHSKETPTTKCNIPKVAGWQKSHSVVNVFWGFSKMLKTTFLRKTSEGCLWKKYIFLLKQTHTCHIIRGILQYAQNIFQSHLNNNQC